MTHLKFRGATPEVLNESTILIIEDSRVQRMMLRQAFENLGFKNIYEAEDGKKGLYKTLEVKPDLVILDINMPVMDGFKYCQYARYNAELKNMTILVQTGLTDLQHKTKIFESGATDFITKPIDLNEIASRSFVNLERALHVKKLETFTARVSQDLESAKKVLESTLPNSDTINSLKSKYKIDLAAEFKSSNEMGGDLWGLEKLNETQLAIYCIDFAGHGLDSAPNAIRAHSILTTHENKPSKPGDFLVWFNKILTDLLPVGNFATMFYGIIDTKEDILSYATASCPSPVLLYKNSFPAKLLSGAGYPLGATKDATFETESVPFKTGDTLILYSDALLEVEMKNGEILGEDRLVDSFEIFTTQEKFDSKKSLENFLQNFYNEYGNNLKDDLTINVYHRML